MHARRLLSWQKIFDLMPALHAGGRPKSVAVTISRCTSLRSAATATSVRESCEFSQLHSADALNGDFGNSFVASFDFLGENGRAHIKIVGESSQVQRLSRAGAVIHDLREPSSPATGLSFLTGGRTSDGVSAIAQHPTDSSQVPKGAFVKYGT